MLIGNLSSGKAGTKGGGWKKFNLYKIYINNNNIADKIDIEIGSSITQMNDVVIIAYPQPPPAVSTHWW